MVLDWGHGCEESKTTYKLKVEREHDGVRLKMEMQEERDNVLPGGGEEV